MQTISTQNWTQITGLSSDKTYNLQALAITNAPQPNVYGYYPISVMWLQQGSVPQSTDIGMIDTKIKAKGSTAIYVKSLATPINVVVQEVI